MQAVGDLRGQLATMQATLDRVARELREIKHEREERKRRLRPGCAHGVPWSAWCDACVNELAPVRPVAAAEYRRDVRQRSAVAGGV